MAKWSDERERNLVRKRDEKLKHEVEIPPCADRERRNRLEQDDIAWLQFYFGPESGSESPFTYEFTVQQTEMIAALGRAIVEGGDQSIAASRGEGKTILCERMILKCVLTGSVKFAVLFAATGSAAENTLESIKLEIERNERLRADYPEACIPVLALENTPNRAHYQIVRGKRHDTGEGFAEHRSKFSWCGQQIYFPDVPGAPCSGSIIATRGLDAAVRGLKIKGHRVGVAVIDDPDTEDTARSEAQAKKLGVRIDRAIAGLGGQKRRVARVMLTTIQSRISASFVFTSAEDKPSWQPKRFRFMVKKPDRVDMWDEYVHLKRADWYNATQGDPTDHAHEYYVANREEMKAGADVANPNRYSHGELDAIQHYYNQVARTSYEDVATEYDNDPPEDADLVKLGISRELVQRRLSGLERLELPPECKVTVAIDLGKSFCHVVMGATRPGGACSIVHYDVIEVIGTEGVSDRDAKGRQVIERAILRALIDWKDQWDAHPLRDSDGNPVEFEKVLIDTGYFPDAVYEFVRKYGDRYRGTKGLGEGRFSHGQASLKRKVGNHWFATPQVAAKVWLYELDADFWKRAVHERFIAEPFDEENRPNPGALTLFIPQGGRNHRTYSAHILAEEWTTEFIPGKGEKSKFLKHSGNNHYLDATAMVLAGAEMAGVGLFGSARKVVPPSQRPTAQQLAGRK